MSSKEYEKVIFLHILKNPDYFKNTTSDYFEEREIGLLFDLSKKFHERFHEVPTKDQLSLIAKNEKNRDQISEKMVDIIFDEPYDSYDPEWINQTSQAWILWKNFNLSLVDTLQYAKSVKITPDSINDVILKAKTMFNDRNSISFNKELGADFFNPETHKINAEDKITSNHKFVDQLTSGGYYTKSLIVYAGEQNIGKSIWLANDAVNYTRAGYNVAVISAEMTDKQYIHRIGANMLNIKIDEYEAMASDPQRIKARLDALTKGINPPGKLFVKAVPTSEASVFDIESYLKEEELANGIKFRVIVIDYINILLNARNPNTESTYIKIKQLSEDLRAMAIRNNWLVITATQVNRSGMDTSDFSMTSISESSGLGFTADVVYGIIQDSDMYLNREYWLKVLKIRNGGGKLSKCKYKIMYEYMRLIETEETIRQDDGFN